MRFRHMDPNDPNDRPRMPFVLEGAGGKGEADSPAGLAALLVGREYADVDDEETAWRMRLSALEGFALWLAALGRRAVVVDGTTGPVFDPFGGGGGPPAEAELRVDGDYAMVASLQRAGLIRLWERGRAFRDPGSAPARCLDCRYLRGGRCEQFDAPADPEEPGCLDGVSKAALNGARRHEEVALAELPPRRLKARNPEAERREDAQH